MTIANATQLIEANEIAFLHAEICQESPQSYTLDEKRRICESIDETNAAIEEAIRGDFAILPPRSQARILDLLQQTQPEAFYWWMSLLVGDMPDSPPDE